MTQPRLLGGRYELDGVVGRGGMAEVYRARDIRLDRVVAVKTLREDLARDATFQARFRREAQSAASLNHPSIVAVYDTGEDTTNNSHIPYIVMEYVDGRTLRDLLRDDRRLLPERALEITEGVLRALDYSHRSGIIHRDIKPGNVMLTRSGQVKVMDFGIARAVSDAQATMTQTAQVIGTAQYLSPEQARGERVDARSDLYSTGCLLYELLTGRPPFLGDSPVAIAYQHVRENPVPPSQIDREVPQWADAIVLRAMAKDPRARYQTAGDMSADIQRALSGVPVAGPRPGYGTTQRMGAATAMAGPPTTAVPGYEYGPPDGSGIPPDPSRRRRALLLWALGVLVVIGIVAYAAHALLGGSSGTPVPLVANSSLKSAESQLRHAGLKYTVTFQNSTTTPKNTVISTSPAGGSLVPASTVVKIIASKGPKLVQVPYVKHKTVTDATSILKNAGFKVATQTVTNSAAAPNTVVGETPAAGSQAPFGSTVTLRITGKGVPIPPVLNEVLSLARQQLSNRGFTNVVVQYQMEPGFSNHIVTAVNPPVGTVVSPSTQITLTVVRNPPPTPTPSPSSPTPTPSPSTPTPTPSTSTPPASASVPVPKR